MCYAVEQAGVFTDIDAHLELTGHEAPYMPRMKVSLACRNTQLRNYNALCNHNNYSLFSCALLCMCVCVVCNVCALQIAYSKGTTFLVNGKQSRMFRGFDSVFGGGILRSPIGDSGWKYR